MYNHKLAELLEQYIANTGHIDINSGSREKVTQEDVLAIFKILADRLIELEKQIKERRSI